MTGSLLLNNRFMALIASAIIIIAFVNPSITLAQELNKTLENGDSLKIYSINASKVSPLSESFMAEEARYIWPLVFDAEEDFSHPTGENGEGDYKKHSSGYLISGPGYPLPDEADFKATFYLRRGKYGECLLKDPFSGKCLMVEEERRLFALEVWDVSNDNIADKSVPSMTPAKVDVKWKFLERENEYYPCTVDFTTRGLPPDHRFDFRVKWWSWWNGEVDRVELNLAKGILELPDNPTFKNLREKADVWDDNIQKNHLVNSQIVTKTINGKVEEIGDSAI